jgi:hypothetical protein
MRIFKRRRLKEAGYQFAIQSGVGFSLRNEDSTYHEAQVFHKTLKKIANALAESAD